MFIWFTVPLWLGVAIWILSAISNSSARNKAVAERSRQAAALAASTKKCPECAETIMREAKVCRFCGCKDVGPAHRALTTQGYVHPTSKPIFTNDTRIKSDWPQTVDAAAWQASGLTPMQQAMRARRHA